MSRKKSSEKHNIAFFTSSVYDQQYDINGDIVIIRSDFKTAKKKNLIMEKTRIFRAFFREFILGGFL